MQNLQADPSQLNAVHSRLLETLYIQSTDSRTAKPGQDARGQPASLGGDGAGRSLGAIDWERCTRVATEWQRQLEALKHKATPQSALAYEALAVVRMLGQQDYSGVAGCLHSPGQPCS